MVAALQCCICGSGPVVEDLCAGQSGHISGCVFLLLWTCWPVVYVALGHSGANEDLSFAYMHILDTGHMSEPSNLSIHLFICLRGRILTRCVEQFGSVTLGRRISHQIM